MAAAEELSSRHMAIALFAALLLHGVLLWHFALPEVEPMAQPRELRVQVLAAVAELASRTAPPAPAPPPPVERRTPPSPPESTPEPRPEPPPAPRAEPPPLQEPPPVAEPQPPPAPAAPPEPKPERPEPVAEVREPAPAAEPLPETPDHVAEAPQPEAAVIDTQALMRYEHLLLAWLERHKHYPRRARRLRIEGEGRLRIRIDGEGRAVALELERSTGNRLLDRAALDMARRAAPYPPPPKVDGELEFVVPVVFALR